MAVVRGIRPSRRILPDAGAVAVRFIAVGSGSHGRLLEQCHSGHCGPVRSAVIQDPNRHLLRLLGD